MKIPKQRILVWFSCGITSACAAKLATDNFINSEVLYCDTLKHEHPDNLRFMLEVEQWIGKKIKILKSHKYTDIFDVFDKTGWLVGPGGARCTTELKRNVREAYQLPGDIHVFGFSAEETKRIQRFKENNPELHLLFPLADAEMSKQDCANMLLAAGIALPEMYRLGYKNNNCVGCVKGYAGYWNKIRLDFPEVFARMAAQERKMGVRILEVYLDELSPNAGRYKSELNIECGPACNLS